MSLQTILFVFFVLQAMTTVASAEVAWRYSAWWSAIGKMGTRTALRSLVLGIAFTHLALTLHGINWLVEQAASPSLILPGSEQMVAGYCRAVPIRVLIFAGVALHLIPLWRIAYRYSLSRMLACVGLRAGLTALAVVAFALHLF